MPNGDAIRLFRCAEQRFRWATWWMVVVLLAGLLFLPVRASAQDDARADQMFEALKQREYFDLADRFLESLGQGGLVTDEWKRTIPFRRAAVLIKVAETSSSDDVDRRLSEARDLLKRFVEENPGTAETEDANMELAKLRMAQGHRAVAQAAGLEDKKARQKLLKEAGTAFRSAESQFRQRKNTLGEQLKEIQKSGEAQQEVPLDKMRSDFLYARMTVAMLEFEQAKLVKADKKKYDKQMQEALKEFGKISKEFRERLIGLEAIHYQGLCYQDLGQYETALDYYEQLLQLSELPDPLKTRTLSRVIECYVKLERAARALTLGEKWLARGGEQSQTAAAAEVSVGLGEAYIAAAQLESGRKQQRNFDAAREQLMRAARIPGPQQNRARALLATLPAAPVKQVDPSQVNDFATAKLAADQARDQMQATKALVDLQRRKLDTAEEQDRRAVAQAEWQSAEENLKRFQTAALSQYRQALAMANADAAQDDVNDVRYMIAYLHYQAELHMEAAVVAEYVAQRFPNAKLAKDCANIAMACYWKLHQEAPAAEKQFATDHMIRIADLIATRWPGGAEAEGALVNLVNLTVAQGDAAKAEEYLNRIPEDSAARVPAELRTGAGLWRLWLKQSRQAGADQTTDESVRDRAESLLVRALGKSRDNPPDSAVVQAALALAQLQIETGRPSAAVELLRDEKIGPMTLVDQKHAAVGGVGFVEQSYRVLLKALIGQLAEGEVSADAAIGEATATMDALKQVVGDSPEGQQRLIKTYVALAKDLRGQIEVALPDTKEKLRLGFVAFLDRVAESESLSTRHWVAETYLGMADDIVGVETSTLR